MPLRITRWFIRRRFLSPSSVFLFSLSLSLTDVLWLYIRPDILLRNWLRNMHNAMTTVRIYITAVSFIYLLIQAHIYGGLCPFKSSSQQLRAESSQDELTLSVPRNKRANEFNFVHVIEFFLFDYLVCSDYMDLSFRLSRIVFISFKWLCLLLLTFLSARAKSFVSLVSNGFPHRRGNAVSSSGQSDIADMCWHLHPLYMPHLNTLYDVNIN